MAHNLNCPIDCIEKHTPEERIEKLARRVLELEQKLKNVNYVYAELEKNLFRADRRIVEQDNMIKVLREQEQKLRQILTSEENIK